MLYLTSGTYERFNLYFLTKRIFTFSQNVFLFLVKSAIILCKIIRIKTEIYKKKNILSKKFYLNVFYHNLLVKKKKNYRVAVSLTFILTDLNTRPGLWFYDRS